MVLQVVPLPDAILPTLRCRYSFRCCVSPRQKEASASQPRTTLAPLRVSRAPTSLCVSHLLQKTANNLNLESSCSRRTPESQLGCVWPTLHTAVYVVKSEKLCRILLAYTPSGMASNNNNSNSSRTKKDDIQPTAGTYRLAGYPRG